MPHITPSGDFLALCRLIAMKLGKMNAGAEKRQIEPER